jgi:hypothetical protein
MVERSLLITEPDRVGGHGALIASASATLGHSIADLVGESLK